MFSLVSLSLSALFFHAPGMTTGARRPGSHAVVGAYKEVARVDGIVSVCEPLDELPVYEARTLPTVSTLMIRAQRI